MTKHVLIVGEGVGKIKEKLREMFRATEVGKDTLLFDEPSLAEEEKEFQRFMELHRRACEEIGVASAKVEQKITAREIAEAVERLRALQVKLPTLDDDLQRQAEIMEMLDKGLLQIREPMFEPRIIPYDPPPYRGFYDEFRTEAMLSSYIASEAMAIRNLRACPRCGCLIEGTNFCPDCGNEIVEG